MLRSVVLVLALAACGGSRGKPPPPAQPAPPPVDRAALAEVAAALEEVLATMAAITSGAPDCTTMAQQLGALFDRSEPLFAIARDHGRDPVAGPALTAELDARAAGVKPLVDRISGGLARCRGDAAVVTVMERMPTL